jgi:uroporphyrinogen decarboxylase
VDRDQKLLAESLIHFQKIYGLDFVKMMPNGLYSAMDFGIGIAHTTDPRKTDQVQRYGIEKVEDWERLESFQPERWFSELESLALVFQSLGRTVPVVETIFSPLTTAEKIAGPNLVSHLREYPEKVHVGLEYLTEVTVKFVQACMEVGIDGIFFATACATSELMTNEEYKEFGCPYDLKVLEAARYSWFNILHVHGLNTFDLFDYPVAALNYPDRRCKRSLKETRSLFSGVLIGGIDEVDTLINGPMDRISQQVNEAIHQLDGKGLIVGPGCVVDLHTPKEFLRVARQTVER